MKRFSVQKTPLYLEVKKILLEAIETGQIGDADGKLPSEEVLTEKFNVSRSTIRSTLQSLEVDGIISIRHGIGTFIKPSAVNMKLRIDTVKGFYQLILDSGHKPSILEPELDRVVLESRICRLLDLPDKTEAILLKRIFLGNGKPAFFVLEYIPVAILTKEPEIDNIPESIFQFADTFCSESIDYAITEIASIKADAGLNAKMKLGAKVTF